MATGCSGESFNSAFISAAVRPTSALMRRTSPKASSPTTRARMPAHASHAAVFPHAVVPGSGLGGPSGAGVPRVPVLWVAVVLTAVTVAEVMGHGQRLTINNGLWLCTCYRCERSLWTCRAYTRALRVPEPCD